MIAGVASTAAAMSEAASDELIAATDIADLLVRLGCPSARPTVSSLGSCARRRRAKPLSELTPGELAAHSAVLAEHWRVP